MVDYFHNAVFYQHNCVKLGAKGGYHYPSWLDLTKSTTVAWIWAPSNLITVIFICQCDEISLPVRSPQHSQISFCRRQKAGDWRNSTSAYHYLLRRDIAPDQLSLSHRLFYSNIPARQFGGRRFSINFYAKFRVTFHSMHPTPNRLQASGSHRH